MTSEINLKRKVIEATDAVRKKIRRLNYKHLKTGWGLKSFTSPLLLN